MDDIFAVDDDDVDVVRRTVEVDSPRSALEGDSFEPQQETTTRAPPPVSGVNRHESQAEDEFNFDYLPARTTQPADVVPFDLGLDREVVVKKRVPQAKLNEERLLGPNGIPKIRDELAKKIKFRGKGHEIQDLGRFIEHYQFWAHELYPKAKFRDSLKMITKVGKTKSMKAQRRNIIVDSLPRPEYMDDANSDEQSSDLDVATARTGNTDTAASSTPNLEQGRSASVDLFMRDDELELSDFEDEGVHTMASSRRAQGPQGIANDIPDEMPIEEVDDIDDLDALEAMGMQV